MSQTFVKVQKLVREEKIKISAHGYDELAEDGIFIRDIIVGVQQGRVVEDYPEFGKGPCTLVLQHDLKGNPVHVVWGIPMGFSEPAVLVTAYRPDPARWTSDFTRRKK